MLGVARNPKLWKGDEVLKQIAEESGIGHTFHATKDGVFFGEENALSLIHIFGGEDPSVWAVLTAADVWSDAGITQDTLPKNYLYFAEKNGAEVQSQRVEVTDVTTPHPNPSP